MLQTKDVYFSMLHNFYLEQNFEKLKFTKIFSFKNTKLIVLKENVDSPITRLLSSREEPYMDGISTRYHFEVLHLTQNTLYNKIY